MFNLLLTYNLARGTSANGEITLNQPKEIEMPDCQASVGSSNERAAFNDHGIKGYTPSSNESGRKQKRHREKVSKGSWDHRRCNIAQTMHTC